MGLLLPRTDAGVLVQLVVTLVVGVPLVVRFARRRQWDLTWFAGGVVVLLLGWYALRTVH